MRGVGHGRKTLASVANKKTNISESRTEGDSRVCSRGLDFSEGFPPSRMSITTGGWNHSSKQRKPQNICTVLLIAVHFKEK